MQVAVLKTWLNCIGKEDNFFIWRNPIPISYWRANIKLNDLKLTKEKEVLEERAGKFSMVGGRDDEIGVRMMVLL